MVAFGRPVVPEVNASRATSSDGGRDVVVRRRLVRPSASANPAEPPNGTTRTPSSAASSSVPSRNRSSTSARSIRAISWIVASSPGRSSGIVVTATAPVFSTPNQQAVSHGLLGPRSSTRLPGTMPRSSTRAWAIRFAAASRSAYDQVSRARGVQARPVPPVLGDDVVQQRGRAVQPVGVVQLGQVEGQLRPLLGRRQVVAAERVDVGGRQQLHPGNVWTVSNDRQECDIRVPPESARPRPAPERPA